MFKTVLICLPLCLAVASDREQTPPPLISHPSQVSTESLPFGDPIAFLKECIKRFDERHLQGYTLTLLKQERIGTRLQDSEEIKVSYRIKPHSVYFKWIRGERMAASALYVEGENGDQMLAHPAGIPGKLLPVVSRDPDGSDAKQSGRYSMREFGIRATMARTLGGFERHRAANDLKVQYLGVVKIKELGDRLCYGFRRINPRPEPDAFDAIGFDEITVYVDKETWIQVGTLQKMKDGRLVGEYLFKDIQFNPTFKADQFSRAILTQ